VNAVFWHEGAHDETIVFSATNLSAGAAMTGTNQMEASSALGAFGKAVERLEQVIELETKVLMENKPADLREFNHRKNFGLLELTRTMRALDGMPSEQIRLLLVNLRSKLDRNRKALDIHLRAVQEISAIISKAIRDSESDGTYSVSMGSGYKR
jgi:hypothetical protein